MTTWTFAGLALAVAIGVAPAWIDGQGGQGIVHQVRIVGQNDDRADLLFNRRFLELSVEESRHIRAATGYVSCPGTKYGNLTTTSASLIISNGQVLTTAHTFIDEKGRRREPLSTCYFENQADPMVKIPLLGKKGSYIFGSNDPVRSGGPAADFAIARLSHPLEGIEPFPVDLSEQPVTMCPDGSGEANGCWVLVISAAEEGITIGDRATSGIDWKHAIARTCAYRVRLPPRRGGSETYLGDCDISGGASGGANFVRDNGQLVLKAMTVGDAKHGKDYLPFHYDRRHPKNDNYSISIGISKTLLRDAIKLDKKFNH